MAPRAFKTKSKLRRQVAPSLLLLAIALSAQVIDAQPLECLAPATAMARVELLFGAASAGDQTRSDAQWRQFVDEVVTPRFPDGFTELTGQGQWRRPDGVITREPSRVLLIWYTPSAHSGADIDAIRAAYTARFAQASVMRVDGIDCVSF